MRTIQITIHEYWHTGSGRGDGLGADAVVVRSAAGLPYLPGRSLKGLLRDAVSMAEELQHVPEGVTTQLFGSQLQPLQGTDTLAAQQRTTRFDTTPGHLRFSNARLGRSQDEQRQWESWATDATSRPLVEGLYAAIASTAMEDGIAKDATLRTTEVVVPLTLYAMVDADDQADRWIDQLRTAMPLVRSLGRGRTRGLGRCSMVLLDEERT